MTSPISKPSTVKPLEEWERKAWAEYNIAEEKERYARFQSYSFEDKLKFLEARGREMAEWRERREAQAAATIPNRSAKPTTS